MGAIKQLPAGFEDLQPFAGQWALPTGPERYQARLSATMDEIQAFYDAVTTHGEKALAYLEQFEDLPGMPDDARHLMWLLASFSYISFCVDVFKQPQIPDSNAATLDWVLEPAM
jgi:hypothetical protein